ncbi:substrate-binding domain-containing protein [Burkholderia lata]|uniref:substrate-binding domain-containing protein n=1 Tax=Burkholderia TaxID=32008 RepID=UPI003B007034
MFSGKLTNWNQVINLETRAAYTTNAPIKVVYRSDGSGTTELLTRHLAAVCTTANRASGVKFIDLLTFANTWALPAGMPPTFIAASGDGGIRASLASLTSIGTAAVAYLSPVYANATTALDTLSPPRGAAMQATHRSSTATVSTSCRRASGQPSRRTS